MNEMDSPGPSMVLVKVCSAGPNTIEEHEVILPEQNEKRLTTLEVMTLATKTLVWCCDVFKCKYAIPIRPGELDAVPFLIVRHLISDHGMTPNEVVEKEPCSAHEVRDYCRAMGFETPVREQTGVPTKMGTPR